jgi:predicted N-acetyltransferase YhbS
LAEYNALRDAARVRAIALRREAIDTFWLQLGGLSVQGARSARRLASRLARHSADRAGASGTAFRLEA